MMRGPSWDQAFPADRMIPALRETLAGLGVDLDSQGERAPRPSRIGR